MNAASAYRELTVTIGCSLTAADQSQRMVPHLLHIVPPIGRLLRPEHVRRCRRRELPQVPRESGAGREGETRS